MLLSMLKSCPITNYSKLIDGIWRKKDNFGIVTMKYRQRQHSVSWWDTVCMARKEFPQDCSNIQSRTKRNNSFFLWKFMDVQVKKNTNLISMSSVLFDNLPLLVYKPVPSQ